MSTRYGPAPTPADVSTSDPENDPYQIWQADRTSGNLRKVVQHYQPTINKAVGVYAKNASPVLKQRANLLAAKAIKGFDGSRGASLDTHIMRQLQALQRMAPEINDPLPMPERMRRDSGALMTAISSAVDDLGREPTDEQLSEMTGIPRARVSRVRNLMRSGISESQYNEGYGSDDADLPASHGDQDGREEWLDAVYHDLSPQDQLILQYRTGYRGAQQLSNQQIARQLGLSPSRVSERAKRIQQMLDEFDA